MNRREFFKILGATAVATALPIDAVAKLSARGTLLTPFGLAEFFQGKEFGRAIFIPGSYLMHVGWANEFLIEDAASFLPTGSVIQLRGCIPSDYGRSRNIAWYTNQMIALSEPTGLYPAKVNPLGGYFDFGSVRV